MIWLEVIVLPVSKQVEHETQEHAHYWTIEDRDEFAVFASKSEEDIAHVGQNPELLGETEYLVCKYDSIHPSFGWIQSLKQYMHELRSSTRSERSSVKKKRYHHTSVVHLRS